MNKLHLDSQKENKTSKSGIKPIIGKILTGVSLSAALLVGEGIKNTANADIDISQFGFLTLAQKRTPQVIVSDGIESLNTINKLINENKLKEINIEIKDMFLDIKNLEKTIKNNSALGEIKNNLKILSEKINESDKDITKETIKILKDEYILLWNQLSQKSK
ncbi:MAG: hypothetical protein PHZ26_05500 [Candidatus Gracilibacteria bacterium]|nr:hypothetical protein [Candidatus Gracilibacteria bacterium]MDD2909171.1 hypothetical protein [Candidatus Gracilibacteria bacterium]